MAMTLQLTFKVITDSQHEGSSKADTCIGVGSTGAELVISR